MVCIPVLLAALCRVVLWLWDQPSCTTLVKHCLPLHMETFCSRLCGWATRQTFCSLAPARCGSFLLQGPLLPRALTAFSVFSKLFLYVPYDVELLLSLSLELRRSLHLEHRRALLEC